MLDRSAMQSPLRSSGSLPTVGKRYHLKIAVQWHKNKITLSETLQTDLSFCPGAAAPRTAAATHRRSCHTAYNTAHAPHR